MSEQELPELEAPPETGPEPPEPEAAEAEQPQEPGEPRAAAAGLPGFSYNDRLYALGYSTTGKSEVLNVIFSGLRCQRLLIDHKPEFVVPGLEPARNPDEIDWSAPVIHYQPAPGSDCTQYEQIFARAFTRRGLVVCAHELGALVDYNPGKAGRYLISYLSQGARLGLGLLAGAQRPVLVPTAGLTEANHVLVFAQLSRQQDNVAAAEAISPVDGEPISHHELTAELGQLRAEHGQYAFLWKARDTGALVAVPPLPEDLRSRSIIKRL